ncbi:MAG: serine protease [Bdellovibrionaceae bacterium]|nr:serine protease [Pseudobdellovibrionaceae bacterium]
MSLFTKFSLLLSFFISVSVAADLKPFIVGGSEATEGEFPFIVSLQANGMGHICGGSLIKKNWVLTAGHCTEGGHIKKVYLGLHDQNDKTRSEVRKPKRIIRHPQYNEQTTDFDYALIELDSDSTYTPVEMNREEIQVPTQPAQIMTVAAGWGETSRMFKMLDAADRLQKVEVPLVPAQICGQSYNGMITDRMLCAGFASGGKDSCYGDSGGPLTMKGTDGVTRLIGVVSWGEGCAAPNKYGVYSKVNMVQDWVDQTTL